MCSRYRIVVVFFPIISIARFNHRIFPQTGFYGFHCESHSCSRKLCQNQGECFFNSLHNFTIEENFRFKCDCDNGFYGTRCEKTVNTNGIVKGSVSDPIDVTFPTHRSHQMVIYAILLLLALFSIVIIVLHLHKSFRIKVQR